MITREHAWRLRRLIEQASASLPDADALGGVELFPHWSSQKYYAVGERVNYNGTLFKCLTSHSSQPSWTPDVSPSLWVRVDDPDVEWPEWVQPVGSTDAYPLGAKVSHLDKHWISDYDNNIWEPSVYGWSEAT